MKKLNLLQQALIEEKKISAELLGKLSGKKNNIQLLNALLPNYKPQSKQKAFHKSNAYEKGVKGGYGSGKTIALCAEAILLAYINRPLAVIISSVSEDSIELTTLKTLKELCKANDLQYEYIKDNGLFNIIFGQREDERGNIYLIGQKFFKGPNVAAVGFDEPFSQRKETYENLIARVRNSKAKRLEVFWSGTPEPDKMEWGVEYFERDSDTESLFTVTIATVENVYLPKSFIKSLNNKYDAKTREVYLEGKHRLLSANPAYHAFERKRNTFAFNIKINNGEIIAGFDFNVDPMCAAVFYFENGVYYQIKEFSINNSNTKELCAAVTAYLLAQINPKDRSDNLCYKKKSVIITGDASGKRRGTRSTMSDYEIIRDEFIKAEIPFYFVLPEENPPVRDRINHVNKLLESELYLIHDSCIKTIADRELVTWKPTGEGFVLDKRKKDRTHSSDAADYALFNTQILSTATGEDEAGSFYEKRKGR